MKQLPLILFALATFSAGAQTKKIAFKSHSGSEAHFTIALNDHHSGLEYSNFGVAPQPRIQEAQLDSVIYVCDTLVWMVTSYYCSPRNSGRNTDATLWKSGKARVPNHPLFSKQHALDSIRQVLRTNYHFRNPVEKVVFINYDNDKECKNINSCGDKNDLVMNGTGTAIPPGPPRDRTIVPAVAGILLLSLAGGFIAWLRYRRQERKIKKWAWA